VVKGSDGTRNYAGGGRQSPAGNGVSTEADDIVGICYQATTGEDAEDLMCAVVRRWVRELARAL
jgi:hypothetical protein